MQVASTSIRAPRLILIHGMLSTPLEFGLLAQPFRQRGIDHVALEIPGYTLADPKSTTTWQHWLELTRTALDAVLEPGEPIVIGGLCMGGVFAAALTQEKRYNIVGLVMMSPTFEYDGWSLSHWTKWRKLAYFLHVDQFISIREREPFGIKNPKIRKWIARDMQQRHASAVGPSKLPLRALREGERLMAQVAHALPQISCPTLIMHAREDEITSLASVQRLCEKLPTKQRELIVLEESYHMITIDNDRGKVADELTCFMKKFGETSSRPLEFLRTTSKPQPQNHGVIPIAVAA